MKGGKLSMNNKKNKKANHVESVQLGMGGGIFSPKNIPTNSFGFGKSNNHFVVSATPQNQQIRYQQNQINNQNYLSSADSPNYPIDGQSIGDQLVNSLQIAEDVSINQYLKKQSKTNKQKDQISQLMASLNKESRQNTIQVVQSPNGTQNFTRSNRGSVGANKSENKTKNQNNNLSSNNTINYLTKNTKGITKDIFGKQQQQGVGQLISNMQLVRPQDISSQKALFKRKREEAKKVKQNNYKNINKSGSKYLSQFNTLTNENAPGQILSLIPSQEIQIQNAFEQSFADQGMQIQGNKQALNQQPNSYLLNELYKQEMIELQNQRSLNKTKTNAQQGLKKNKGHAGTQAQNFQRKTNPLLVEPYMGNLSNQNAASMKRILETSYNLANLNMSLNQIPGQNINGLYSPLDAHNFQPQKQISLNREYQNNLKNKQQQNYQQKKSYLEQNNFIQMNDQNMTGPLFNYQMNNIENGQFPVNQINRNSNLQISEQNSGESSLQKQINEYQLALQNQNFLQNKKNLNSSLLTQNYAPHLLLQNFHGNGYPPNFQSIQNQNTIKSPQNSQLQQQQILQLQQHQLLLQNNNFLSQQVNQGTVTGQNIKTTQSRRKTPQNVNQSTFKTLQNSNQGALNLQNQQYNMQQLFLQTLSPQSLSSQQKQAQIQNLSFQQNHFNMITSPQAPSMQISLTSPNNNSNKTSNQNNFKNSNINIYSFNDSSMNKFKNPNTVFQMLNNFIVPPQNQQTIQPSSQAPLNTTWTANTNKKSSKSQNKSNVTQNQMQRNTIKTEKIQQILAQQNLQQYLSPKNLTLQQQQQAFRQETIQLQQLQQLQSCNNQLKFQGVNGNVQKQQNQQCKQNLSNIDYEEDTLDQSNNNTILSIDQQLHGALQNYQHNQKINQNNYSVINK